MQKSARPIEPPRCFHHPIRRQVAVDAPTKNNQDYYAGPGSQVETGETLEQDGIREAREEAELHIALYRVL